jgi:hypothetical protein
VRRRLTGVAARGALEWSRPDELELEERALHRREVLPGEMMVARSEKTGAYGRLAASASPRVAGLIAANSCALTTSDTDP